MSQKQTQRRTQKKRAYRPDRLILSDWVSIALCILLPPVGLVLLWGRNRVALRGRIVLTALGAVVLTWLIVLFLPSASRMGNPIRPVPHTAERVSYEDTSSVIDSLSNMDALVASQQAAESLAKAGDSASSEISSAEALSNEEDKQATLSTIVYTVWGGGSKYYHVAEYCDRQHNGRALTLAEAMAMKLAACPNCDPIVFRYLDTEKVITD